MKKLADMKKDTLEKKQKKYVVLDAKAEEIVMRTNNNKKLTSKFYMDEKLIEIQRNNDCLVKKLESIHTKKGNVKYSS